MVDLVQLLSDAIGNPFVFFVLVFVYAVLAAIILPIPIEFVLFGFLNGGSVVLITVAILAIASGKATGAWLVFFLGVRTEHVIHRWTEGEEFMPVAYRALKRQGLLNPSGVERAAERILVEFRRKGLPRHIPVKAFLRKVFRALEKFVRVTGAGGLYLLLSIPLMTDTVPIYFYAIFNEEGRAIPRSQFILSNFLAGVNRAAIILIVFLAFGVQIVG